MWLTPPKARVRKENTVFTLSNKIKKVLELGNKMNENSNHADLIKYINSRSPRSSDIEEFVFMRKGEKIIISDRALRRIINFAVNFNLIDKKTSTLTKDGTLAIQSEESFAPILRGAIRKFLKNKYNYDLKDLGTQVENVYNVDSCKIPLPEQIWRLINDDVKVKNKDLNKDDQIKKIPLKTLRTVLNLLADCEYLNVYRKKMYTYPKSSQDKLLVDVLDI